MQTRFITRLTPSFTMLLAGGGLLWTPSAVGASVSPAADLDPIYCFDEFLNLRENCKDTFLDPFEPDYADEAYLNCLNGVSVAYEACINDATDNPKWVAIKEIHFKQYLDNIKICMSEFEGDATGRALCLETALRTLEEQIEDLLGSQSTGGNVPVDGAGTINMGGGGIVIGLQATSQGTVVSDSGVASATPGIRAAFLLLTFETINGTQAIFVDRDADLADGVSLRIDLDDLDLTNSDTVVATVFYVNHDDTLYAVNCGMISVLESGIVGDWNRDGSYDNADFVTYIDGLVAGVDRADLNDDGVNDGVDLLEFAGQLP